MFAVLGCGNDVGGPGLTSADPAWDLGLPSPVATMSNVAPYDTFRIHVQPKRASGASAASRGPITFATASRAISVDAQGVVTAYDPTDAAIVRVTLQDTISNVTLTDSVRIRVTTEAHPPTLTNFHLGLAPGDSVELPIYPGGDNLFFVSDGVPAYKALVLMATDIDGNDLTTQIAPTFVSHSAALDVDAQGVVTGKLPNQHGYIVVSSTFYGVTMRDSINLAVAYRAVEVIDPEFNFAATSLDAPLPDTMTIVVGGSVIFRAAMTSYSKTAAMQYHVQFDDPTAAQSSPLAIGSPYGTGDGNIATIDPVFLDLVNGNLDDAIACLDGTRTCGEIRRFATPGTYVYHIVPWGFTGVIVVAPKP